jgi:hypothetical protein
MPHDHPEVPTMSAPTDSESQRLRTAVIALAIGLALLGVLIVLGLCAALAYVAWQHPGAEAPIGVAVGGLGAIGTMVGALFAGIAIWRRWS